MIKYFGDAIYNIESSEYRFENAETSMLNCNKTNNTSSVVLHGDSIITTIVAGNENEDVDYKLEKESVGVLIEKKLPSSRSESDIFIELQSQTSPSKSDEKKQNIQNQTESRDAPSQW